MKKQTLKPILFLCLVSCILCLKVNAQIVYTDVNPDSAISCNASGSCSDIYNLDFNTDGITDFELWFSFNRMTHSGGTLCSWYRYTDNCYAYPKNQNAIASDSIGGLAKNALSAINSSLGWRDTNTSHGYNLLAYYSYTSAKHCPPAPAFSSHSGNLYNQIDNYLGLKIIKNGLTYYGWVRLQMNYAFSITVKDYAYNSIPNQPILAGETSCANPTVNLTQSGPLSFCAGDSVTLTANGTGYQYQWKKNNVNITGAKSQTYVTKTAGIYKCKVTNSCGIKTSAGKTVTIPCRMTYENIVETLEHLSVYPNPATNSITVKFPSDEAGEISIVNHFGQIIFSEKTNAEQAQIDVSKFSTGMYVVKWSSGENNETKIFSVIK